MAIFTVNNTLVTKDLVSIDRNKIVITTKNTLKICLKSEKEFLNYGRYLWLKKILHIRKLSN